MAIGVAHASGVRVTAPGRGEVSLRMPVLAFHFRNERDYSIFNPEKTMALLKAKGMYSTDLSPEFNRIHHQRAGATIPIATPEIFIDVLGERPCDREEAESISMKTFNKIFPGKSYLVDGKILIDEGSAVGEGSHLIGGELMNLQTAEPMILRVIGSSLRENLWATDCYIENCQVREGSIYNEDAPSKENDLSARAIFSYFKNSSMFGRFDLASFAAINSLLEFSETRMEALMEIRFENSVLPLGRRVTEGQSIVGLMEEEMKLAGLIRKKPSILTDIIKICHRRDVSQSIWFASLPREGRITSLAAALIEIANNQALFLKRISPILKNVKGADKGELVERFRLIAERLNPKIAELI